MADLALDSNHDLLIEDDKLSIVDGDDALVQHLTIRLRFFRKEWFLDARVGVPYYDKILIKNPRLVTVRGILRQAILTTPGVATIERFDFVYDNAIRKMQLDFSVRKEADGELLDFSREFIVG